MGELAGAVGAGLKPAPTTGGGRVCMGPRRKGPWHGHDNEGRIER
jgi:hypothetical protein